MSARFPFPPVRRLGSSVIRFSTSACLFLIEWKLTLTRRSGLFAMLGLRPCLGVGNEAASGGPGFPPMLWIELSSWRLEKEFDVTRDVKSKSVAV